MLSPEDLRYQFQKMQAFHDQISQDLQVIAQSIGNFKLVQAKYISAKESLKSVEPEAAGKEMMVPITESLYVNSKVKGDGKVVIELGTGYFVEKTISRAREFFDRKIDFVTKRMSELQNVARGKNAEKRE